MGLELIASLSTVCLFFGMLLFSEIGRRIGVARLAHDSEGLAKGAGAAEAAVFGLLGLLSPSRSPARRRGSKTAGT